MKKISLPKIKEIYVGAIIQGLGAGMIRFKVMCIKMHGCNTQKVKPNKKTQKDGFNKTHVQKYTFLFDCKATQVTLKSC